MPDLPIRRGLQYRLTLAATVLFFAGSLVVVWQLLVLHRELSQREGENMVWALAQAQHQATLLERDLARLRLQQSDAEDIHLQADLLHSRLSLLTDGPQRRILRHYGQLDALLPAMAAFEQVDLLQLLIGTDNPVAQQELRMLIAALAAAGNQVMVREREEKSRRLDQLEQWIKAAFAAIGMVALCGGWLMWQLVAALQRQRTNARTIAAQRDALQQTIHDLHRAQSATETYRNFVSLVSHQFRTPLAVIDSTAQRLMRQARRSGGEQSEQVLERMGETRHTVEGLTRLLDSVLTSVKLDGGGIQLQARPVNLAELASHVVEGNKPMLGERQVSIECQDPPADYVCAGDAQLLIHLLHNLLANACKYTPVGSPLDLRLERAGDRLHCSVRDHGSGVAAEELPLLFERFYRSARSHGSEGTGLGLYLARAIARLHGGDLNAFLPPDGGLAFTLSLPVLNKNRDGVSQDNERACSTAESER